MMKTRSLCRTAFLCIVGAVLMAISDSAAIAAVSSPERTMPAGYTQLDWVRSNGRQIVDTGVSVAPETVVEMSFGNVCYSRQTALFGLSWGSSFMFALQNDGANRLMMYSGGSQIVAYDSTPADVDFTVRAGNGQVKVTNVNAGDSKTMDLPLPTATSSKISVFASSDGVHGAAFTFYAMTISGANGALLRDFVPCRNPDGEVGLWDSVSQSFFPNTGAERLFTSDEPDVLLTRINVACGAYIDTGFPANQNSRIAIDVLADHQQECFFAAWSTKWNIGAFGLSNDGSNMYVGFNGGYNASSNPKAPASVYDGQRHVFELDKGVVKVDGVTKLTCNSATFGTTYPVYLFATDGVGKYSAPNNKSQIVTCYGARVYDNGTLVRDLVPVRRADGMIGMVDAQNGNTFYENKGFATEYTNKMTWDGIAYALDGTTLDVHEGVLAADDVTHYAAVRKVDWYKLDASAVTSYPGALTLAKGFFSLKDGVARSHTVAGALTLGLGVKLELDVSGEGCDAISAQSFILSATAASPVDVRVNAVGVSALDPAAKFELFPGATFAAGDAEKFTVSGMPVKLVVEDGRLYLVGKDAGEAVWTGNAGDGKWSSAGNWTGETVPTDGMTVKFNLADGGETTFDLADGRTFKSIVFGENAGAFAIAGSATIGVTDAIENESSAAQSISAPCTFGLAGLAFEFACAGDITFGSTASEVAAETLVKTGAGQLVLADTTLWKAANVTVKAGLFKTTYSGLVNAITPRDGVLTVEDGGMLDIDREFGNVSAPTARVEPFHGKTIVIEGDGDGRGALYNSYMSANWGPLFGKVVLAGDASMGGSTLTVRPMASSRIPGAAVEGAYTLTVKGGLLDSESGKRAFCFYETVFALDRVNVTGWMDIECGQAVQSGLITNGVHLLDGAGLTLYHITVPTNCIPVVAEPGVSTLYCGYNSTTASGVTVLPGSTLLVDVIKSQTLRLDGTLTVNGVLDKTAAEGVALLGGTLVGNGTLKGGSIRFNGENARWAMAADDTGFTSKVDISGATDTTFLSALKAIDVTYTGTTRQTLEISSAFGLTLEQVQGISLNVTDGDGLPVDGCWLGVDDGKVQLHVLDNMMAVTARWIGGADSALDDPSNWECFDGEGNRIHGVLPMFLSVVDIPDGRVFNCTNGAPFACKRLNLPSYLSADCDLRGVSAELGGTVDLKGRKIYLSTTKGEVTFTDGEYVFLESLRAPKGAYIDTDFIPTPKTRTVMDLIVGGAKENWFGESGGGTGGWYRQLAYAVGNNPNSVYLGFGNNSGNGDSTAYRPAGWRGKVELNKNVYSAYEPGATEPCTTFSIDYSEFTAKNTMFLFAHHTDSETNYVKADNNITCFGCKIWDDGTLVRDYVPAQRVSDGVVGLIDRANNDEFKPSASATAFVAGRVLGAENGGEVHFDIPKGKTETNASIFFKGTVKVVKEGAGTLLAAKTEQAYAGGTEVVGGTFRCGADGSSCIYGAQGSAVTVREGAIFDCDGWCNHNLFRFVLDGGTMTSQTDRYPGLVVNWFTDVELTKDSFWRGYNYGLADANAGPCQLQMNGHVLTVDMTDDGEFFACNLTVEGGGEIYMRTGGWIALGGSRNGVAVKSGTNVKAETTTLHMGNAAIDDLGGEHVFRSYVSEGGSEDDRANTVIKVLDRFAPGTRWHATELQDGATLDLSGCTDSWNTDCEFPKSGTTATTIFSADATIIVDLGNRKTKSSKPVVTWGTKPENVKFCLAPGMRGWLEFKDDGLYRYTGFGVIVR